MSLPHTGVRFVALNVPRFSQQADIEKRLNYDATTIEHAGPLSRV